MSTQTIEHSDVCLLQRLRIDPTFETPTFDERPYIDKFHIFLLGIDDDDGHLQLK